MWIEEVLIKNFRAIKEARIPMSKYTCFVGPNGVGKSTVLSALNLFFRNLDDDTYGNGQLSKSDFHSEDVESPIEISVTFAGLSEAAQSDLKDYVRGKKLTITSIATFSEVSQVVSITQHGERLVIMDFANYFKSKKEKATAEELKSIYDDLKIQYSDLPAAATGPKRELALRQYEETNPDLRETLRSDDQFYGFTKGKNLLDRHIQWVYVPAVKNATDETRESKTTALGQLLNYTIKSEVSFTEEVEKIRDVAKASIDSLIQEKQPVLEGLSARLNDHISMWAHPGAELKLKWAQDEKTARIEEPFALVHASERGFEGNLEKFGHGLQRSYIMVILQELAKSQHDGQVSLLLGCEEPELYQHPIQEKHLANVLQQLTETNCQCILTSHSPSFVSGERFENIRLTVRQTVDSPTEFRSLSIDKVRSKLKDVLGDEQPSILGVTAKLHQVLNAELNEMFFASRVLFVEGPEDVAYLTTYMHLMEVWDEFRKLGGAIIPVGGKTNLLRPLVIAEGLDLRFFAMFDADTETTNKKTKPEIEGMVKQHNAILSMCGLQHHDPFPNTPILADALFVWPDDLSKTLKEEIGPEKWDQAWTKTREYYDYAPNLEKTKTAAAMTMVMAWEEGARSESLKQVCEIVVGA